MKKIIILIIILISVFFNQLEAKSETQKISIKTGFNFVSFTVIPSLTINDLKSLNTPIEDIYLFSPSAGSFLSFSDGTLSSINIGKGYIIKALSPFTLTIEGTQVTTYGSLFLKSNFNLLGLSKVPETITFKQLMEKYPEIKGIYKWNPSSGSFIQVLRNNTAIFLLDGIDPTITAGQAYFIDLNNDTTLSYDYGTIYIGTQPLAKLTAPTISPTGGSYTTIQSITISCSTSGATIYYTLDGSTPSETNGRIYTTPLSISTSCTLKAIAYKNAMITSDIVQATFDINEQKFVGNWKGNWLISSGQGGMVNLIISNTGNLTGSIFNTTFNSIAPMAGIIDNSGNFNATYQYPNQPTVSFNGTLSFSTTMANTLLCSYSGAIGLQTYNGIAALTSQIATATNNPYMGVWTGNFQLSNGNIGSIYFSIDSKGSIAGSVYNKTYNLNGTVNGNIDYAGVFYGTHQYPNSAAGAITGTFSSTGTNTVQCKFYNFIGTQTLIGNSNLTRQ